MFNQTGYNSAPFSALEFKYEGFVLVESVLELKEDPLDIQVVSKANVSLIVIEEYLLDVHTAVVLNVSTLGVKEEFLEIRMVKPLPVDLAIFVEELLDYKTVKQINFNTIYYVYEPLQLVVQKVKQIPVSILVKKEDLLNIYVWTEVQKVDLAVIKESFGLELLIRLNTSLNEYVEEVLDPVVYLKRWYLVPVNQLDIYMQSLYVSVGNVTYINNITEIFDDFFDAHLELRINPPQSVIRQDSPTAFQGYPSYIIDSTTLLEGIEELLGGIEILKPLNWFTLEIQREFKDPKLIHLSRITLLEIIEDLLNIDFSTKLFIKNTLELKEELLPIYHYYRARVKSILEYRQLLLKLDVNYRVIVDLAQLVEEVQEPKIKLVMLMALIEVIMELVPVGINIQDLLKQKLFAELFAGETTTMDIVAKTYCYLGTEDNDLVNVVQESEQTTCNTVVVNWEL